MNSQATKLAAYQREAIRFAQCQADWDGRVPNVPEDDVDEPEIIYERDYEPIKWEELP